MTDVTQVNEESDSSFLKGFWMWKCWKVEQKKPDQLSLKRKDSFSMKKKVFLWPQQFVLNSFAKHRNDDEPRMCVTKKPQYLRLESTLKVSSQSAESHLKWFSRNRGMALSWWGSSGGAIGSTGHIQIFHKAQYARRAHVHFGREWPWRSNMAKQLTS